MQASEAGTKPVFKYKDVDYPLEATVLDGEEEQEYWKQFQLSKMAVFESKLQNKKKFGRNKHGKRKQFSKDDEDDISTKKSKRIVFEDNDEDIKAETTDKLSPEKCVSTTDVATSIEIKSENC